MSLGPHDSITLTPLIPLQATLSASPAEACRQQAVTLEGGSGSGDEVKREIGALSDVEERVASVREIEGPEHRHILRHRILPAAECGIEPTLAELRLAL